MNSKHNIEKIIFNDDEMSISIDGVIHQFRLHNISKKLSKAAAFERECYEVSPSGYGIHWPVLDEDLSIDALLGVQSCPSFMYKKAA